MADSVVKYNILNIDSSDGIVMVKVGLINKLYVVTQVWAGKLVEFL